MTWRINRPKCTCRGVGLFAEQTACQVTSTDKSHYAERPSCSSEERRRQNGVDNIEKEPHGVVILVEAHGVERLWR